MHRRLALEAPPDPPAEELADFKPVPLEVVAPAAPKVAKKMTPRKVLATKVQKTPKKV